MEKVMPALYWVLARLEEPSTWAGTGLLAVAAHQLLPHSTADALIALGVALGGFLAVVIPQPHNTPPLNVAPGVDLKTATVVTMPGVANTEAVAVASNTTPSVLTVSNH